MVAVVDYGMGNLHSVRSALEMSGAEVEVTRDPDALRRADRIVLPGVGAFGECIANLRASGMVEALEDEVLRKGKPLFGICVGMQVLMSEGHEMGVHPGLNWIRGIVRRFDVDSTRLKVPHVGWNEVMPARDGGLFAGLPINATFYFVHSYHVVPDEPDCVAAACDYGERFTAAILKNNVFATQFHPEKSQLHGLRLLENFLAWRP